MRRYRCRDYMLLWNSITFYQTLWKSCIGICRWKVPVSRHNTYSSFSWFLCLREKKQPVDINVILSLFALFCCLRRFCITQMTLFWFPGRDSWIEGSVFQKRSALCPLWMSRLWSKVVWERASHCLRMVVGRVKGWLECYGVGTSWRKERGQFRYDVFYCFECITVLCGIEREPDEGVFGMKGCFER